MKAWRAVAAALATACTASVPERKPAPALPVKTPTDVPAWTGERLFRGDVGGTARIVMRLEIENGRARGRYFYESAPGDLTLDGDFERGVLELREQTLDGQLSGRFRGRLEPGGAITGTWEDPRAARRLSFELRPVTPAWQAGSPLPLMARRARLVRAARSPHPLPDIKGCVDDARYLEIVGAFEARTEDALNARLRPQSLPVETECDTGYVYETTSAVHWNRSGLLSVSYEHAYCCGAHPSFSKSFVNLTVPAGKELKLADLLKPGAKAELERLLTPAVSATAAEIGGGDTTEILAVLTHAPAEFTIEEQGLRLSAFNSQPHAVQAAFRGGFLIRWDELRPLLAPTAPLR